MNEATLNYRLPSDLAQDIDVYDGEVKRCLAGEMPPAVLKAKRVPRGVYEQRRDGSYMVRVRVAGGVLHAAQARELAALSREYGNGMLHVTTRQDVQLHDLAIADTPAVMRRLLAVGLTSKGGGGNTVRNVMACPHAGVCPAERFDVTPCALAVTEYLIPLVGSYNLPRKYKIAFSGCAADCALAQVADLGFVAEARDGRPGFQVYAGGGMGAQSRIADRLFDWVPATDIIRIAETVRRLFDRLGDRGNKHRARLRFVLERIGPTAFREQVVAGLRQAEADGVPAWTGETPVFNAPLAPAPPAMTSLAGTRIIRQRQADVVAVPLHCPMGFLPAHDFERIAELSARFSQEAGMRTTRTQDMIIRFVPRQALADLTAALQSLETDVLTSSPLDRFVACAGAATCRLGICLARDAARACAAELMEAGIGRETLDAMAVHINGCSNSCGQQPIAGLGLFGAAQRVDGRLVPSYGITLGGRCDARGARFGYLAGKLPARSLAACLAGLVRDFEARRRTNESFPDYVDRMGNAHFEALIVPYQAVPSLDKAPEFVRDLGADEPFSLAGRGAGECGAGVFEVIQQDLDQAREAETPFDILLPSVRALLITRGVDARDPDTVLREFERHFVDTGLVPEDTRALLTRARGFTQGWTVALEGYETAIEALRERVAQLFAGLDANLQFHPPPSAETGQSEPPADPSPLPDSPAPDDDDANIPTLDLRGVACPMNFVKAKLKLEMMAIGQSLAILLDDGEPIRNVPASFKSEGQAVEVVTDQGDGHWRVVVKKRL